MAYCLRHGEIDRSWNDDRGGEAGFQVRRPFRRLETLNGMAWLLPLDEAQARLLALAEALPIDTLAVADAGGRWAASHTIARRSHHAADMSALDGYAVRHLHFQGPYNLIGQSRKKQ